MPGSVFTPALKEAGWSKLDTQIVFSVGLATFAVVMVFAGQKLKYWGPQKLAVIGGLTLGSGYLLAGLAGATNFWAVCLGCGSGGGRRNRPRLCGTHRCRYALVSRPQRDDNRAGGGGIWLRRHGLGQTGWHLGWLISSIGLAGTFMVYGIIFASLVLLGSLWMRMPPKGWLPEGFELPLQKAGSGGEEFTPVEMLSTPQFHLICLTFAVSAGAGLMSIGLMKLYPMEALQASGYSPLQSSAIAGTAMAVFFSIANGIGRIVWGTLSDKLGRKRSVIYMAGSQGLFLLAFASLAGNEYLLYLGATLIGFNFGGNFALFPALTADEFGNSSVGGNYPYVFLSYGAGGIIFPILGGVLGDIGNFPLRLLYLWSRLPDRRHRLSIVFPPHHDEAMKHFSVHGFFHQAHLFDHDEVHGEH